MSSYGISSEVLTALAHAPPDRQEAALEALNGTAPKPVAEGKKPLLMRVVEAARLLGLSRTTFWRMVQAGAVRKVELYPGAYRVRRSEIEALADGKPQAKGGV